MVKQNTQKFLSNQQKYNSLNLLIKLSANCGLSAFYNGYCLTSFNTINYNNISNIFGLQEYPKGLTQGLLTGSTCFTAAIGALFSSFLISRYSRRQCLMILSCATILLSIFSQIPTFLTLALARIGQGLVIGNISCITPLYMRQMMPKEVSGPLWSFHQVLFVVGLSFGFILAYLLSFFMESTSYWRFIFGFPLITSIIQLINFKYFFTFDTPKWNIINGNEQGARLSLQYIYKSQYVESVLKQVIDAYNYAKNKKRISQVTQSYQAQIQMQIIEVEGNQKGQRKIKEIKQLNQQIKNKPLNNKLAVFAAFFLASQQQLLGTVTVQQYAGQMTLKTFPSLQKLMPVIISLLGIGGSIYSIQAMRLWGRRQIILGGVCILTIFQLLGYLLFLGFNFKNVQQNSIIIRLIIILILFVIRIMMSGAVGPTSWLYIAQIIQPNIMPWCFMISWMSLGLISTLFPILCELQNGSPILVFLLSGIIGATFYIIDYKVLVQTKNKTQLEIRKQYDQKWQ